jgi:hypothetical protein
MEDWKKKDEDNKAFTKWRERVRKGLPALAARVFALRQKPYVGCGFHWIMEKQLGGVMREICDFDNGSIYHGERAWFEQWTLRFSVCQLYKDVKEAENNPIRPEVSS